MIVDFSVRNYCSIDNEITLSFVPLAVITELSDLYFLEPKKGIKLLKFGTILGANASGKTTILRALEILRMLVCEPLGNKTRPLSFQDPYWFNSPSDVPTELSIHFVVSELQYHYTVSFNKLYVVHEQLRAKDKTWKTIYTRKTDVEKQTVRISIGRLFNKHKEDFLQLEKATLWNNTVLGGFLKVSVDIPSIRCVVEWFRSYLYPMIAPDTNLYGYVSSLIDQKKISKERLLQYLRAADLMIEDFEIKKDSWDNLSESIRMKLVESNPDLSLEEIKQRFPARHVEFVHSNGESCVSVNYVNESLGTQRFYQLCGILDMLLHQKCFFFIDEIDSSIHPDLLEFMLITFLENSKESQLLITSHHREWLMNEDYVRPDSVLFTEKNPDGSTQLYKLADFLSINKFNRSFSYYEAYRRGVLGATPSVQNFVIEESERKMY